MAGWTSVATLWCLAAFAMPQPLFDAPFRVSGTGDEDNRLASAPVQLSPGETYLFSFTARRARSGSGIVVSGPECANVDWSIQDPVAAVRQFVFRTPEGLSPRLERFHLGGWRMTGDVIFEAVSVRPVKAVWNTCRGIVLGHGESMDGNLYSFSAPLDSAGRNDARPLLSHNAGFNSNRWCFHGKQHVTYRHSVAGRKFLSGQASVTCGYHERGSLTIEASADGTNWTVLGVLTNTATASFALPSDFFPADAVSVRAAGGKNASLQLYSYCFDGKVDGMPECVFGSTRYVDASTGELVEQVRASTYYDEDYGERVAASDGIVCWCASSARKVPQRRRPPSAAAKDEGIWIRTAANESEAVQVVVSAADGGLRNVRVKLAVALSDGVRTLPASAVDVRRVGYVHVAQPTDASGCKAWWPDPLLPQHPSGCDVAAGENQPFRIRVKPPKGTPKGCYRGMLSVESSRGNLEIPVSVEVFGFELPDTMACETAFGFWANPVFDYHGVKDAAQRRKVLEKYLRLLSDNHISPYDPAPLDGWKVTWKGLKEDPRAAEPVFDWTAWDAAMDKAFNEYHFNTVQIRVAGLGGGTFHSRTEPSFMGYPATNDVYDALMAKYLGGIEAHLREKGWLDKAYVYWFDEPEPDDYAFVMKGFLTLKRHAPALRRMLTEQPEDELAGGPNLWCPLTPHLHTAAEPACRAAGDGFWWYVCCSPKAPYVTEFIDHPGVEMRLWPWQTWKEAVHGLLIWETAYWTSAAAYPDVPQNPYEDPMSWVNGYSTPKGVKRPWGNGDGRLIYPPLAAANGRPSDPVLDDPVPSFRLEMLCDGIEDYEYFSMLKRRLQTASQSQKSKYSPLLAVPDSVTKSMTEFAVDSAPVEAHRIRLARALEDLGV